MCVCVRALSGTREPTRLDGPWKRLVPQAPSPPLPPHPPSPGTLPLAPMRYVRMLRSQNPQGEGLPSTLPSHCNLLRATHCFRVLQEGLCGTVSVHLCALHHGGSMSFYTPPTFGAPNQPTNRWGTGSGPLASQDTRLGLWRRVLRARSCWRCLALSPRRLQSSCPKNCGCVVLLLWCSAQGSISHVRRGLSWAPGPRIHANTIAARMQWHAVAPVVRVRVLELGSVDHRWLYFCCMVQVTSEADRVFLLRGFRIVLERAG